MSSLPLDSASPRLHRRRTRPILIALTLVVALALAGTSNAQSEAPPCHAPPDGLAEAHDTEHQTPGGEEARSLDLPDVELIDQDGHPVRLYRDLISDRVVAMNFIFTTCTTICPPMGASFGRLQKELGDLLGSEVGLVSVSIDPTTDTPPRLKSWGEKFGAGRSWSLLTGSKQDVDQVLRALEVFTPTPEDHGPIVLLGNDRTHRWLRVNGLTPPAKLATMLEDLLKENRSSQQEEGR